MEGGPSSVRTVQVSMIGSVFSNLLLVMGCTFFVGGVRYPAQKYNAHASTANGALLLLSVMAMLMPSLLRSTGQEAIEGDAILSLSRVVSWTMLFVYGALI